MNVNHDESGRFSSGGGGSVQVRMGSGAKDRRMVDLLRERLSAGGLKSGEKESIQRRIEQHSKNIVTGRQGKPANWAKMDAMDRAAWREGLQPAGSGEPNQATGGQRTFRAAALKDSPEGAAFKRERALVWKHRAASIARKNRLMSK